MKSSKVLITGGSGYIGSILTKELLNRGYAVTVYDNLLYNQQSLLQFFGIPGFSFVHGDVRDVKQLFTLVAQHDIIIPLAAIVGAPACDRNKDAATEINLSQIKNIVSVLSKDQKIIIPNTNSQYGSSTEIITEESPFKPLSHYSITKCAAEKCVLDSGNGIALRLATVFGISPRMRLDLLVNDFTYRAFNDGFLVLFESSFKRNYIHVKDVANAFIFMIENYGKYNNAAFNVGLSSANLSKMELALKIKQYLPSLVIKEDNFAQDKDKRNYIVSNAKLEKAGWKAQYSLDDGIAELIAAYPIIQASQNRLYTNL